MTGPSIPIAPMDAITIEAAALAKLDEVVNYLDGEAACPRCSKAQWGEEHHGPECIFRGAYDFLADPFPAAQRLLDIQTAAVEYCLARQAHVRRDGEPSDTELAEAMIALYRACGFESSPVPGHWSREDQSDQGHRSDTL